MRKKTVLVWHKYNFKLYVFKGKRQSINLSCFHLSNKGNQQHKTWFLLNISSFIDCQRKRVSVTFREEYNFLDQQKRCFFSLKSIYISNKILLGHSQKLSVQKFLAQRLLKTQRVSVTWPKLQHVSDQDQKDGSLTAMFFSHVDIYIWCF